MVVGLKKIFLRGSILEPVVSIVILVFTVGMALTILTKMNSATPVKAVNKANEIISEVLFETFTQADYLDKEWQEGAFSVERQVKYNQESGILEVFIKVTDIKSRVLAEKRISKIDYTLRE